MGLAIALEVRASQNWIKPFNQIRFPQIRRRLSQARDDGDAYFNPGKGNPHSLVKADGSLSRLGRLYQEV